MSKHTPYSLYESIIPHCSISCSKCGKVDDRCTMDEDDSCRYYFKHGWRATQKNTYCPKCAKKFIPSLKKPAQ